MNEFEAYMDEVSLKQIRLSEMGITRLATDAANEPLNFDMLRDKSIEIFCSSAGSANCRLLGPAPSSKPACNDFTARYYRYNHHVWQEQKIYVIDGPCYINVRSGVVFFEDGAVIANTIYNSSGERTFERLVGGGVTRENLHEEMQNAPVITGDEIFAPLFSRWSTVYFHAICECGVHDALLSQHFGKNRLSYVIPKQINSVQRLAIENASFATTEIERPLVKIRRVAITTALYTHSLMNHDFAQFVGREKNKAHWKEAELARRSAKRVYVSRKGAEARQMQNEADLQIALGKLGFIPFIADGLNFAQQVASFANAEFVIGAHGAGMTNAAFANVGAVLFELRPLNRRGDSPMWGMSYLKLSAIMGFTYCAHVSENAIDTDEWSADIDEIVSAVRKIINKEDGWKVRPYEK